MEYRHILAHPSIGTLAIELMKVVKQARELNTRHLEASERADCSRPRTSDPHPLSDPGLRLFLPLPRTRSSGRAGAGSGADQVFGGLAAGVEVPVEACDVVGVLEWGAFWGAWRACYPCADRDMAGVDALVGQ